MLKFLTLSLILVIFNTRAVAQTPGVEIDFKMSPVGSFTAKTSDVVGEASLENGKVVAKGISVPLKDLTTGMNLRDTHMKEKYLEIAKYPQAELIVGEGQGGKGKATLKIHGEQKEVEGSYEVKNNKFVAAEFPIKLSDFKITGVKHLGVGVKDEALVKVVVPLSAQKAKPTTK